MKIAEPIYQVGNWQVIPLLPPLVLGDGTVVVEESFSIYDCRGSARRLLDIVKGELSALLLADLYHEEEVA
jgi:hypothetical protein